MGCAATYSAMPKVECTITLPVSHSETFNAHQVWRAIMPKSGSPSANRAVALTRLDRCIAQNDLDTTTMTASLKLVHISALFAFSA